MCSRRGEVRVEPRRRFRFEAEAALSADVTHSAGLDEKRNAASLWAPDPVSGERMGNIRMDLAVGSRPGSFREPRSEQTSLSIRVLRCPAGAALQAGGRRFDPGWLHSSRLDGPP